VDTFHSNLQWIIHTKRLSRGQHLQAEVVGASAKVRAGRTAAAKGAGAWGLAAEQLRDGADDTDFEKEGFEEIPF
jgi:hypothetical protein